MKKLTEDQKASLDRVIDTAISCANERLEYEEAVIVIGNEILPLATLPTGFEKAMKTARYMIAKHHGDLAKATEREDWSKAAEISAYTDGMVQLLVVFELLEERERSKQNVEPS